MKVGNSKVDFKGLIIDGPNGRQSMEPKIIKLLSVLVDNAGEVMTREELIDGVWGVDYGGDERLSRAISILRKALGDKRGQHTNIVTISRVGYRLIAKVSDDADFATAQTLRPSKLEMVSSVEKSTSHLGEINTLSEAVDDNVVASNFSFKQIASTVTIALSVLIIGIWAVSSLRSSETLSVQARLDSGFAHVENFTADDAIIGAQQAFNSILSDDPNHAAARAGLAFALFREYTHLERDPELLKRGRSHAEAAFRQDEHLALSNIAVAWAAEFEGNVERAHEHLDRAGILDPDHPLALEGRYRSFARKGQMQSARDTLNTATTLYPDKALFYAYQGDYLIRDGDFEESEASLRRAIELAPDNSRTYAQLAQSLYLQGRTDDAISETQKGLKVNETALLYNNLGTYLFFQGHYNLAASAFEKTLGLDGDTHSFLFWANLGDAYRWSDNKEDEAATAYKRALQLLKTELDSYPESANLKSRAAMFNAKLGNLDEARSHMNSFSMTPSSESILFYRAVITYEILSERGKALENLEAAINADYPLIEIYNDPELSRLRQDPSYHRLLAKTQTE